MATIVPLASCHLGRKSSSDPAALTRIALPWRRSRNTAWRMHKWTRTTSVTGSRLLSARRLPCASIHSSSLSGPLACGPYTRFSAATVPRKSRSVANWTSRNPSRASPKASTYEFGSTSERIGLVARNNSAGTKSERKSPLGRFVSASSLLGMPQRNRSQLAGAARRASTWPAHAMSMPAIKTSMRAICCIGVLYSTICKGHRLSP